MADNEVAVSFLPDDCSHGGHRVFYWAGRSVWLGRTILEKWSADHCHTFDCPHDAIVGANANQMAQSLLSFAKIGHITL